MTNTAQAGSADPRRWPALTVSLVGAFMVLLDVSIVNVALPSIEREFGVSAGTVQWVVSGYALTFGLALVPAGRLGDTIGRRRMFLIALSAFVLTSALTGAAQTTGWLLAARLLQGVAGGMLIPQNIGLIQDLFRGAERARAFGLLGSVVGLSTATGPVVGGLILDLAGSQDGWRWVFYVNVPIGLVALVLAARLVPARNTAGTRGTHLDLVGSLLLGAGVLGLLLPVVSNESGGAGWLWWLVVPAALLLAAFARWEVRTAARGRAPLLDPQLARTAGFTTGSAIALVYFTGFTGIWVVLALFFQDGLGYSPLHSGLAVTPFALGSAVSAVFAGRAVPRFGRWLNVTGLLAAAIGMGATALVLRTVSGDAAAWAAAGPLLVAGLGGGMVVSPNTTLTLESVPAQIAGAAGGALQTAQRIGAAIGTALLATVYYHALTGSDLDFAAAVSDALLCAAGLMLLALLIAVAELIERRHRSLPPAPPGGTGTAADPASPQTAPHEAVTP
ncbi:MAG: transporter [Modestobacter sp.]|nr:transporter [Modestobacter sp.]